MWLKSETRAGRRDLKSIGARANRTPVSDSLQWWYQVTHNFNEFVIRQRTLNKHANCIIFVRYIFSGNS